MRNESKAAEFAKTIPLNYRKLHLRALSGKCSPRSAIKAQCAACMGFENTVEAVRDCTSYICPLYAFRPYRKGANEAVEAE